MTAPLREISVPFRPVRAGWAVQITLGSGRSGDDGVGCTTEGVSTPACAGSPRLVTSGAVRGRGRPLVPGAIARVPDTALPVVFAEDSYLVRQGVASSLRRSRTSTWWPWPLI